jgi:DNA-binding transcriptional MerR regulator
MHVSEYTISDLAAEFDITTRTIRFYEEKGLLTPARDGLNRIYSAGDRTKLKLILRGKRLGLTLEESKEIIGMYQPTHDNSPQLTRLIERIQERRRLLQAQLIDLEDMINDLDGAEERCQQALIEMKRKPRLSAVPKA